MAYGQIAAAGAQTKLIPMRIRKAPIMSVVTFASPV
jgi:hypothetical protein